MITLNDLSNQQQKEYLNKFSALEFTQIMINNDLYLSSILKEFKISFSY